MIITKPKLFILIILQNISSFHPIQYYLNENACKIWNIVYNVILFLILLCLYFLSVKLYNYNNFLNSLLSFIGEFCFVSMVFEMILFFSSTKFDNPKEIIFYTIVKIIASICLYFCLNRIYKKIMMETINTRMFYKNPYNYPFDSNMITSILF